jgi:ketosteroid isomerase-like protein
VSDADLALRYLEAMSVRDFETAELLLARDAEVVVAGEPAISGADFILGVRGFEGLDHLDVTVADRVITEEDGVIVSRSTRVFRWRESGEVAYEQPAEARMTVKDGSITKLELH